MSSRSKGGGRFHVTNDTAETVGASVTVHHEHTSAMNDTKQRESATATQRGHRNCLKKLIEWWMKEYPAYYEAGTKVVTQEEKNDPMLYHHTCDCDIVYEDICVDMVLAYMAANKKKENGNLYSFTHMQKMHDAILFGAQTTKKKLPSLYYSEMDSFLNSFKKENAKAKSDGNVD